MQGAEDDNILPGLTDWWHSILGAVADEHSAAEGCIVEGRTVAVRDGTAVEKVVAEAGEHAGFGTSLGVAYTYIAVH